jgi:hypothetical protein
MPTTPSALDAPPRGWRGVLVALDSLAVRPGLADARAHGQALAAGTPSDLATSGLLFPPIVNLTAL